MNLNAVWCDLQVGGMGQACGGLGSVKFSSKKTDFNHI